MPAGKEQSINELHDTLNAQGRRISLLERQLADAVNGKYPDKENLDPGVIWAISLISNRTNEPMVQIEWFTQMCQVSVQVARSLAFRILSAADAAESDAFLFHHLRNAGLVDRECLGVVKSFRAYRAEQAIKAGGVEPWDFMKTIETEGDGR